MPVYPKHTHDLAIYTSMYIFTKYLNYLINIILENRFFYNYYIYSIYLPDQLSAHNLYKCFYPYFCRFSANRF